LIEIRWLLDRVGLLLLAAMYLGGAVVLGLEHGGPTTSSSGSS